MKLLIILLIASGIVATALTSIQAISNEGIEEKDSSAFLLQVDLSIDPGGPRRHHYADHLVAVGIILAVLAGGGVAGAMLYLTLTAKPNAPEVITPMEATSLKRTGVDVTKWLGNTEWYVVKGTTGCGKTYFVEQLKDKIKSQKKPVVYVPQYPMFKPQLLCTAFLNMLPISPQTLRELYDDLEEMKVPATESGKLIGGKMMGMMDLPGLSGGQRKKLLIGITMAIAREFKNHFIILDEPFAGIDEASMKAVLNVMARTAKVVNNMKFVVVTHDHFDLLPSSATLLKCADRRIKVDAGLGNGYEADTISTATLFCDTFLSLFEAENERAPMIDWYCVKRYFKELEFILPVICCTILGLCTALASVNYHGTVADLSPPWLSNTMSCFEYVHMGSLINYCFKRSQHMEDYFLNITPVLYPFWETVIICLIQGTLLAWYGMGLMTLVNDFCWINLKVACLIWLYNTVTNLGYYLLPILAPNPVIIQIVIFPYVANNVFLNDVMMPYAWQGVDWLKHMSPLFQCGCAMKQASPDDSSGLQLPNTSCYSDSPLHIIFINPWVWVVVIGSLLKKAYTAAA